MSNILNYAIWSPFPPINERFQLCSRTWLSCSWKWKCWSLSRVWLFATPWTRAHQAPLSWNSLGKNTGVGCHFLLKASSWLRDGTWVSCLAGRFFTIWATRKVAVFMFITVFSLITIFNLHVKFIQILPRLTQDVIHYGVWLKARILWFALSFSDGSVGKESSCIAGDSWVWSLGWEDPLEEKNGNPLHYSCLKNPMGRGAWGAIV